MTFTANATKQHCHDHWHLPIVVALILAALSAQLCTATSVLSETISVDTTYYAYTGDALQLWSDLILAGVRIQIILADENCDVSLRSLTFQAGASLSISSPNVGGTVEVRSNVFESNGLFSITTAYPCTLELTDNTFATIALAGVFGPCDILRNTQTSSVDLLSYCTGVSSSSSSALLGGSANALTSVKSQTISVDTTYYAYTGAPVQLWSDLILAGVHVQVILANDDSDVSLRSLTFQAGASLSISSPHLRGTVEVRSTVFESTGIFSITTASPCTLELTDNTFATIALVGVFGPCNILRNTQTSNDNLLSHCSS